MPKVMVVVEMDVLGEVHTSPFASPLREVTLAFET